MFAWLVAYIDTHKQTHSDWKPQKLSILHSLQADTLHRPLHFHIILDLKGATVQSPAEGNSRTAGERCGLNSSHPACCDQLSAGIHRLDSYLIFAHLLKYNPYYTEDESTEK